MATSSHTDTITLLYYSKELMTDITKGTAHRKTVQLATGVCS